jgi:hypothetical protein
LQVKKGIYMKKINIFLTLLFGPQSLLFPVAVNNEGITTALVEVIPSYITTRSPLQFAIGQAPYANGGLTFTYSIENNTLVTTGIQLTGLSDPNAIYSAVVSAAAFQQTTITVYKAVAGVVSEAATNEVIVTIFAITTV